MAKKLRAYGVVNMSGRLWESRFSGLRAMARIAALLPNPVALARLRMVLQFERVSRARHQLLQAEDWHEMHRLAMEVGPQIAVFDPYLGGSLAIDACRHFHEHFPSIVLLPYAAFRFYPPRDVLELAGLGVRRIVCHGDDDDPATFRSLLNDAVSDAAAGRILRALADLVDDELQPLFRHLLVCAHAAVSPDELARAHFCHAKTLRERLRAAGFPPTNKLIVWARLFHAACLLEDPARSVENAALTLDFPSVSALHKQLVRYAGVSPRELRARGGLTYLVERFRAHCSPGSRATSGDPAGSGR